MNDTTTTSRCAQAACSILRRGMRVAVHYTEGSADENWIGCGTFLRHVKPGSGWDYCLKIEPHCIVKTDATDSGSCFPTRCVAPNTADEQRRGKDSA